MDTYISRYYYTNNYLIWCVYLNYFYFYFRKKESKLRPCGQLSKYVGPLDVVATQTVKGRTTLRSCLRSDANGPNQLRFEADMRRAVEYALTLVVVVLSPAEFIAAKPGW
jgi:hypothetical protein